MATPTSRRGRSWPGSVSYLVPIFARVQMVLILGEHPAVGELPRSPMEETEPA